MMYSRRELAGLEEYASKFDAFLVLETALMSDNHNLGARVFKGLSLLAALSKNPIMMRLADACDQMSISPSYGEQLAAILREAGVIVGVRGPGGGYRFAEGAWKIPIMDIVRALAGVHKGGELSLGVRALLMGMEGKSLEDYLDILEHLGKNSR